MMIGSFKIWSKCLLRLPALRPALQKWHKANITTTLRRSGDDQPVDIDMDTMMEDVSMEDAPFAPVDIDGWADLEEAREGTVDIEAYQDHKVVEYPPVPMVRRGVYEFKGLKIMMPEESFNNPGTYRYRMTAEERQEYPDDLRICLYEKKEAGNEEDEEAAITAKRQVKNVYNEEWLIRKGCITEEEEQEKTRLLKAVFDEEWMYNGKKPEEEWVVPEQTVKGECTEEEQQKKMDDIDVKKTEEIKEEPKLSAMAIIKEQKEIQQKLLDRQLEIAEEQNKIKKKLALLAEDQEEKKQQIKLDAYAEKTEHEKEQLIKKDYEQLASIKLENMNN